MTSFQVGSIPLLEAVSAIYPLVPNKPSRDILKCFRISATQGAEDKLTIRCTDLETFAEAIITSTVHVPTEGEFVVPAATLLEYIKALEGGDVNCLVTPEETLKMTENLTEFTLGLQDIDEYPDFPDTPDNAGWFDLELPALTKALKQVVFAVAEKGSPRWGTLNAVCMETGPDGVVLIGTDQHRASIVNLNISETLEENSYLIPSKTLALIPKIFDEEEVKVTCDVDNNIIFKDGTKQIMVRLMHGGFPPVKNFVPSHPKKLELAAGDFLRQVKKSSLATDKHSTLKIELTRDKIKLLTKARQQRKVAKIEFPLTYDGDEFLFAVNCKYMIDILKASDNEPVEMYFNQNNQPILFVQDNFKHLIVPQEVR